MNAYEKAAAELTNNGEMLYVPGNGWCEAAEIADIIAKWVPAPNDWPKGENDPSANCAQKKALPAVVELIRYASQLALSDPAAVAANWQAERFQLHARAVRASAEAEVQK